MALPRRLPTKFYQQDIVRRIQPESNSVTVHGIVMRCWHDAEDIAPPFNSDPLMRPLSPGEVGVSFYRDDTDNSNSFDRQILPERDLELVDRFFHRGDICRRSLDEVESGIVLRSRVNGRCEHVISKERIDGWTTLEQLSDRDYCEVGDLVAFDDWIGQVIELYDEVTVDSGGELVTLPELGSRIAVGDKGPDILPPASSSVHNLFGFLLRNTRPSSNDTCVAVLHSVYAINWLALSQALDPEQAQARKRPQQFWTAADMSHLILIRSLSDLQMRVGDRVTFKDENNLPSTSHGGLDGPQITVKTFSVTETETIVDVLWQNGTKETIRATELIPYVTPDEYDCWPGDHAIWNREGEKLAVIIQTFNATQRTASVLIPETGNIELASVLELDPHGTSDSLAMLQVPSDGLGVRRGDFVFIHPEGKTNGSPVHAPRVPKIGEVEAWVKDIPFIDGQLSGFRKEMDELGASIARRRGTENFNEPPILRPKLNDENFMWFGEVTDVTLDGEVEVTHPNGAIRKYTLQRLTKLYDGIDQLEDDMWDEASEVPADENGPWTEEGAGWDAAGSDYGDDWASHASDSLGGSLERSIPGDDSMPPLVPLPNLESATHSEVGTLQADAIPISNGIQHVPPHNGPNGNSDDPSLDDPDSDEDSGPWKRFDIQPSAPEDHAFYNSAPAQPSKPFLARLTREYRVLSSSLPESILVRAYEDRNDLLRSLIIGPEQTPYADAPFVIDWLLDSNFPHSPPLAHFHSWTNGNGRVNPNLYEEGKVCLSILGTWAGDKIESWHPARSSLLQALVSIQGLVLVKEPWFCEPAYEKLRGTEEGIVNSRLYSEKAFVLSRGFVRRALELPPGGLESEIRWLYRTEGRLDKVINDAEKLIEKSKIESEEGSSELRLSAGGIITLDRILAKLISLRSSG
ncbi:hypothetical protein FB45DRAFT_916544 [Roridomyces roridus]|uniref:UBC core domain-containing protein n=1 Tax=Roridomyces roridus TaxID=1738132 RepID=A0AAD7BUI3_9AGAR|nr:hypothetical protein FB45DRAFT_916544 [Roridomyces roridus]